MEKTVITLAIAAALTATLAGCAPVSTTVAPKETSKAEEAQKPMPSKKATTPTKPAAPALGTLANPADISNAIDGTQYTGGSFSTSFSEFNDNAAELVAKANMFNDKAPAGQHYASVTVSVANTSTDASLAVSPYSAVSDINATDSTGATHAQATVVVDNDLLSTSDIYAGQTATGTIVFLVPDGNASLILGSGGVFIRVQ